MRDIAERETETEAETEPRGEHANGEIESALFQSIVSSS